MKLLILGGTGEAKKITQQLIAMNDLEIIYSIAGLVRKPELSCDIISGGFSPLGGLKKYLAEYHIDALLDITHPFAQRMSEQAIASAAEINIPYYRFLREEWQATNEDRWLFVENETQLLNQLALAINQGKKNIFYTNGQIDRILAQELTAIAELNENFGPARYIIRSAKETERPAHSQWLQAIGPYSFMDEKALFEQFEIDLLVTKNSGGKATQAKLDVARELGIPVIMLQRPKMYSETSVTSRISLHTTSINSDINRSLASADEIFDFLYELLSNDFN